MYRPATWDAEIRNRVPRLKFSKHQGKRRTLARFFARVRRSAERALAHQVLHARGVKRPQRTSKMRRASRPRIIMAYGAAYKSFSTSLRVPTSEAFHACCAVLGKDRVAAASEWCTSKCCCGCHQVVHALYRVDGATEALGWPPDRHPHDVPSKSAPSPTRGRLFIANTPRRRGKGQVIPRAAKEVRGLRFCPDCRSFMDRDVMAAVNIGRSWEQERRTGVRPAAFTPRAAD